ncbi:MAG: glutathione S-transferase N-terminal domain-containing protein [Deltaproteobacteria bacterium]|nr:glutathione S-transferase N-terminal domain-containing protein [Deltaproteobacteria bacterium]
MKVVEIYVTQYCPYCHAAIKLLKSKGLNFTVHDVSDSEKKLALKEKTGWQTVPQIFIDGQMIGGYQELMELDQQGKL